MAKLRTILVALAVVAMTLLIAACGDSSGGGSGTSGSGNRSFKVGYSLPSSQEPSLKAMSDAATKAIEAAGGTVELRDAALDPNKQVSDIQGFIDQHVDVIIAGPALVPQALTAALKRAQDSGIKVLAWQWSYNAQTLGGGAPDAPIDAQVLTDTPTLGADLATDVDRASGGGKGQAIFVGLPFPVTGVDALYGGFQRKMSELGDTVLARVANKSGNPEGAAQVVADALTRYPQANAVVAYSGSAGLGVAAAVRSAGKQIPVFAGALTPDTVEAIKAGKIAVGYDNKPVENGMALGKLAASAAGSGSGGAWKRTVVVHAVPFTQETISSWVPWDQQLADAR